ncbi:MAG: D-alanyl-D-alanine carboxypeptidase/D-alanyl-D-alanine endopeptidase [Jatrophihabitantaceae bacterium]
MSGPRTAVLVLLVVLLAGGAAAGGYFETRALRNHDGPAPTAVNTTPAALRDATRPPTSPGSPSPGPAARAAAVRAELGSSVTDDRLGGRLLAQVVDVTTGTVLYSRNGSLTASPASTAKVLTAAAALAVYPATHRFTTSVVAGPTGTLVLVGGGDPTLTAAPNGRAGAYPDAARISELAAQLKRRHVTVQRIVVDGSLFAGPSVSPFWVPADVPSSYGAPITAAMIDGGRDAPGDAVRSSDPDLAAGRALAAELGAPGVPVVRGTAAKSAAILASVRSAPLSELIEQMLQASDNVIAEDLARMVAVAGDRPASFIGGAQAIRAALRKLGVDVGGGMRDGSGLAASDRLSPAALAAVLRLVAEPTRPALHTVLAGMPVAAWSGTLADRFLKGTPSAGGAGAVRAKTGTITAVSSLAGVVHDRSGRLLAFALIADHVAPSQAATEDAEAALDTIATRLAACGCA